MIAKYRQIFQHFAASGLRRHCVGLPETACPAAAEG
jgi:hypothetical protein